MEKGEATHRTRCFGIVSDAVMWRFLECTRDEKDSPIFKLSSQYIVSYEEKVREQEFMKIVEIIKWLLTEVESDQRKRVKAGEPLVNILGLCQKRGFSFFPPLILVHWRTTLR